MNRAIHRAVWTFVKTTIPSWLAGFVALACAGTATASGRYLEVSYPASTNAGELQLGVTYTVWIPDGVTKIRGVIVHQHGCGTGACKGGATAAYDLHWQALAKKWDCALLGPSYHQTDKQNCRLWCDPRNGSNKTYLKAISEFAVQAKHPELETAPWCLWGHSGGAFWASLMQTMYPERIVAIWFRSGTAFAAWEKGEIPRPEIPAAAYGIPMMCNPGAKEKGDKRFDGAWTGSLAMFRSYRTKGAPVGFAPDPRTAHECGDSRYLAIPFFDACLGMRLPDKASKSQKLQPANMKAAWLATLLSDTAEPAASYAGKSDEAVWLPNERVGKAWMEYVKTGAVGDTTAPPTPFHVKTVTKADHVEITWDAEADFESGIKAFIIQRDGKDLAQVPQKAVGRFGRALFQTMSYHDTPEKPLAEMRFIDRTAKPGAKYEYQVIAVNSVGLQSKPGGARKQGEVRKRTYTYKQVGALEIKADVYRADDDRKRPVVVWIHGGGLIMGHREGISNRLKDEMLNAGYIVVSIDYRLAPETQLPGIITDVEDSLRWIHDKGPQLFHADPERVAISGGSAGGYLTLTAGFRAKTRPVALVAFWGYGEIVGPWLSQSSPHPRHHRVKVTRENAFAQVSGAPIADARDRKGDGGAFYQFCRQTGTWPKAVSGWDPLKEPEKFAPYMALKNVTRDYPPTLLIHGETDTDVPYEQSVLMAAELKRHGVKHRLISLPKAEHGLEGGDGQQIDDAYRAAFAFLREHLDRKSIP